MQAVQSDYMEYDTEAVLASPIPCNQIGRTTSDAWQGREQNVENEQIQVGAAVKGEGVFLLWPWASSQVEGDSLTTIMWATKCYLLEALTQKDF